jgi:hypothetical protein
LDGYKHRTVQLHGPGTKHQDKGWHVLWYVLNGYHYNYGVINGLLLVGYPVPWDWLATNIKKAQDYIKENTTLGIPAIVQTEGMCSSPCILWSRLMTL